ncbi:MAG: hypothetical protein NVS2B9_09510 [Myxococcales bacterium]
MRGPRASLERFSPIGWSEVDRLLGESARTLGRKVPRRSGRTRPLDGFVFALTVPRWAAELAGARLSEATLRRLQLLQAHLLVFFLVYDPLLDGDARAEANPAEMLPLLLALDRGLAAFFSPEDPFWVAYRALVQEQLESARWEIASRGRPSPRFGPALLRSLGRKLSLLRWPAFAVAGLAGRPELAAPLDRAFDRFYRVLQLLDDVTDVERDRAKGQVNAVASAMAELPRRVPFELGSAVGTARVCAAARAELAKIRRELAVPEGRFARVCAYLDERCRSTQLQASVVASHLVTKDVCDRIVSGLS